MCVCLDLPQIGLISAYVWKFGKVLLLRLGWMLLHNHLALAHTFTAPKFGRQTPNITCTTVKTVLCGKFGGQISIISCLCSNVWQKCNVKITCNIIPQSVNKCAYLHRLQAPEDHARICVHNLHANNVAKTNPVGPKCKTNFPPVLNKKLLVIFLI